jgi:hypothetical protein
MASTSYVGFSGGQQSYIFRYHEFVRCFSGVCPCSGTSWFREYTSQISMSNTGFHLIIDIDWIQYSQKGLI